MLPHRLPFTTSQPKICYEIRPNVLPDSRVGILYRCRYATDATVSCLRVTFRLLRLIKLRGPPTRRRGTVLGSGGADVSCRPKQIRVFKRRTRTNARASAKRNEANTVFVVAHEPVSWRATSVQPAAFARSRSPDLCRPSGTSYFPLVVVGSTSRTVLFRLDL